MMMPMASAMMNGPGMGPSDQRESSSNADARLPCGSVTCRPPVYQ